MGLRKNASAPASIAASHRFDRRYHHDRRPVLLAEETLARYRAYQAHLAGQPIGTTFGRTAAFLNLAAADALSITGTGAHAGR
jgi:hypothetical protein